MTCPDNTISVGDCRFWLEKPDKRSGWYVRRQRGQMQLPGAGPYKFEQRAQLIMQRWVQMERARMG